MFIIRLADKKIEGKQSFYQYTCIYTSYGNGNMFIHQSRALRWAFSLKNNNNIIMVITNNR